MYYDKKPFQYNCPSVCLVQMEKYVTETYKPKLWASFLKETHQYPKDTLRIKMFIMYFLPDSLALIIYQSLIKVILYSIRLVHMHQYLYHHLRYL